MRQLPLPGADRRRRARQNHLLRADAERVGVIEDNLTEAQKRIDIIRAAPPWLWLPSKTKGDTP